MGERIFRPGIRTSERTANLVRSGGWMAQVFYDWLITLVDDFGRYDARPKILRVEIFPLLLDLVRESHVERCLAECEKASLIRLYAVDGKPYLELLDFRQRLRAAKSKFPAPTDAGKCRDNVMTMPTDTETDTDSETEAETETPIPPPAARAVCVGFESFWKNYPKHRRSDKQGCLKKWNKRNLESIESTINASLKSHLLCDQWKRGVIPLITTFINQSRWESEQTPAESSKDEFEFDDPTSEQADREFRMLGLIPDNGKAGAA